jgi:hypothetical protein
MRSREIMWGLALAAVGVLLLLGNLGYGGVTWDLLWRLWPGILLYAGFVRIFEYLGV